jgi:PPK2 family polyphosphate:nucleotide phosphotransferase
MAKKIQTKIAKLSQSAKTKPASVSGLKTSPTKTVKSKAGKAAKRDMLKVKTLLKPFRITKGKSFRLKDHPTEDDRKDFDFDKEMSKALLDDGIDNLQKLQEKLYADNRWSVLLVFQAMDAAGKDSTIENVMSGINPQGCQVHSFKKPSEEELDHDFLWRTSKALPERGRIGIFNRSYYEECLVVRVHPEILKKQRMPVQLVTKNIWKKRLKDIRRNEQFLSRQGVKIIKFFLNVGKEEQKKRLFDRIDDPVKNWKFEALDVAERAHWDKYMEAYEAVIQATATKASPWYVIPADDKKLMRVAVLSAIRNELKKLDLAFPTLTPEETAKLAEARKALEASQ